MDIKEFRYNNASEVNVCLINDLFSDVWGDVNAKEIHPKEMDAMSFCAMSGNKCIGYVGVISWDIKVQEEIFKMCGLSCVCTHPQFRKRGVATQLVKRATEWILQCNNFDIGLFTCSYQNTPFYENIGLWEIDPGVILKESSREGAYISNLLHLNVFKLLISQKSKSYADYFENTTILLNFPEGRFI